MKRIQMLPLQMCLLLMLFALTMQAQSVQPLQIEGQGRLDGSAVISTDKRDGNGQQVAAIRLVTNLTNISVQPSNGAVGNVVQETGGVVVYVSPNERKLRVAASGYLPVDIILSEVGIRLEPGQLWELTVTGQQQAERIPVNFDLEPSENGAVLFVDGVRQEGFKNVLLPLGNHQIRIEKTGAKPIEQQIEVSLQRASFSYRLEDIDPLVVEFASSPTGATVYVDQVEKGKTPLQAFYFPGRYQVEWRLSGYLSESREIEVTEPQTNRFEASLTKNTGTLSWTVQPTTAQVLINNQRYSGNSADLAPGLYKIELLAEGYDAYSETIQLERGQSLQKDWQMVQQVGGLQFSVQPSTAKVELLRDGQVVDRWTGLRFTRALPVGSYSLRAKADGYKSTEHSIVISRDAINELSLKLEEGRDDVDYTNSIGMEFIYVAPGNFQMGSNDGQDDEKPVHEVEITQGYYLGKYEVTQAQWQAVMGSNPSSFKGINHPVEQVSWEDAQAFIKKLNQSEGGNYYRLPTEAEWEYAARGGQQSQGYTYSGSNEVKEVAWYSSISGSSTHPVGTKAPNELGIYDMSGNVWEWCADWYSSTYYSQSLQQDPQGPSSGSRRVLRGGSWYDVGGLTRVADRFFGVPIFGFNRHGFRLLRAAD